MRSTTATAAVAAVLSLAVFAVVRHFMNVSMVDMLVYRAEGLAVVNGDDLYAMRLEGWNLPATYPPFAAVLFVATTWFDIGVLRLLVMLLNVALLGALAHFSFRLVGWPRHRHRAAGVLLVAGLGVWLEPIFTTLRYGQINLLVACLVLWDLTRSDRNRLKGVGLGLAIGIKLTPGLFTLYLLLTGRIRAAVVSAATFSATFTFGWLVLPADSFRFWTSALYDSSRVGHVEIVDNQSLRGILSRLLHTTEVSGPALLAAAVAAAVGLSIAVAAVRMGPALHHAEAWGVLCTAVTALLVSPISWTHHWVWCVPLLVLLAAEAVRSRAGGWWAATVATLVSFLSYGMWLTPHKNDKELHLAAWWQPLSGVYPLTGIAFLGLAASLVVRAGRAEREPAVQPAPRWADDLSEPAGAVRRFVQGVVRRAPFA